MKRSRNNNLFIQPAFFGTYGRQKSVLLHSLYTEKAQHFAISNKAGMAHGRCTPDERERLICIYCEGSGVIRSQGRKVVKPFGKSFRASSSEIEGNTTVSYRHTSMKHWKNTTWLENTRMQKKKIPCPAANQLDKPPCACPSVAKHQRNGELRRSCGQWALGTSCCKNRYEENSGKTTFVSEEQCILSLHEPNFLLGVNEEDAPHREGNALVV